jgi:hypothetical protein
MKMEQFSLLTKKNFSINFSPFECDATSKITKTKDYKSLYLSLNNNNNKQPITNLKMKSNLFRFHYRIYFLSACATGQDGISILHDFCL